MSPHRVLIVHPDESTRALSTSMLQSLALRIQEAESDRAAVKWLEHSTADIILAGIAPSDPDALEFLTYLRRKSPRVPVVLLFNEPHADRTREAMLRGATTVLTLPIAANRLRAAVSQSLGLAETAPVHKNGAPTFGASGPQANGTVAGSALGSHLNDRVDSNQESVAGPHFNGYFGHEPAEQGSREVLVGEDSGIRQAIEMATMIAPTRTPVLIVGERGTGKTSLAKMLHDRSPRHEAPFIELCCSSLTEAQLEQELFGKRPTAYGEPERIGKVAQANGGTLFLDEITALSPALQFKLLRLLRDNEFEPIGSNHTLRSDLRLIVGSQDDLAAMVQDGRFRQDLYYRIGVVTLKLTPLRHRGADLERLTDHFRARFAHDINKTVSTFSSEAIERLRQHDWPGNVQELEHVVKCAMVNCRGHRIETSHLVFTPREAPAPATRQPLRSNKAHMPLSILPLKEALEGPEKQLILQALEALNWNRQETARVLDINRTTLYKKMKKYGLLFDEPIWMN